MGNRVIRSFHNAGVAVAVLIAVAGGSWAVLAVLFNGDPVAIVIGSVATAVLALAVWASFAPWAGSLPALDGTEDTTEG